jgi:trans-aconitate 2-methyltransferase
MGSSMSDWDPAQYLRFEAERTRPSMDLAARIGIDEPGTIVDIGCGPGNSARALRERWPRSSILGLDSSPAMIEKARKDYPAQDWVVSDASEFDAEDAYDIVFSNAALQWIPDHESLAPRLLGAVRKGGALAVQIPRFRSMPIHVAIEAVAASDRWRGYTEGCAGQFTYHDAGFYYDSLSPLATRMDIWETFYFHVLPSRSALIDFIRSTGMKPYLDSLPDGGAKAEFEAEVLLEIEAAYPLRPDGHVLFPFHRLFFIAYK